MSDARSYDALERRLGHTFRRIELLEQALTHKSFLNENQGLDRHENERLEFLGDAVVGLVIGHLMFERNPHLREGELSMLRAQLVNEASLAEIADELGVGEWLFLGRGEEQTGGRKKPSLLADACEAIVAAVYLDGGFDAATRVVRGFVDSRVAQTTSPGLLDFKTRLQERAQALHRETPRYAVIGETGPDHAKTFQIAVTFGGREVARADGRSKKEAEQRAAAAALQLIEQETAARRP